MPAQALLLQQKAQPDFAGRAQSLWERLAASSSAGGGTGAQEALSTARLRSWQRTIAGSDGRLFEKRFAWDGVALADVVRVLQAGPVPRNPRALAWLAAFEGILGRDAAAMRAVYARIDAEPDDRVLDLKKPVPFDRLFVPFVRHARRGLRTRTGSRYALLAEAPHVHLERLLLKRLSGICVDVLFEAFTRYKTTRQGGALGSLLGRHAPAAEKTPGNALYAAFLTGLRQGTFYDLLQAYPVAARLCTRVTELWVEAHAEFLHRLADDWETLGRCLGVKEPLGKVTGIRGGLSDPHEGGRSVLIVTFDARHRLVYKPRPIGLERYFADLQEWINRQGGLQPLRVLKLVTRATHGWLEFVEPAPCRDRAAVRRYYQRCGMLLCLLYAVNGSDFHKENLIAVGEHPVLIDMEALLGHHFELRGAGRTEPNALTWANEKMNRSVYWTQMLPRYHFVGKGVAVNSGALGEEPDEGPTAHHVVWTHVNTDAMQTSVQQRTAHEQPNLPRLGKRIAPAHEWAEALVAGFGHTYRLLLAHREALLHPDSPLLRLRGHTGRFLFRNSALYAKLLHNSCKARYLRDNLDRSILFDALSRALVHLEQRPAVWPVLEAERKALAQLDIPNLTVRADSRDLFLPDGTVVKNCFATTAVEATEQRLRQLSEQDLAFQIQLIRDFLYAHPGKDVLPPGRDADDVPQQAGAGPLLRACALEEALGIGEMLSRRIYYTPRGEAIWFGLNYVPAARRYSVGPLNCDLFNGTAGLAVFTAALAKASGQDRFFALTRRAVSTLRCYAREFERNVGVQRSLHNVAMLCGPLIYGFTHVARRLDEPALLAEARRTARLIDERVIRRSACPGVINGTAGLVLSLLALYEATEASEVLLQAQQAGAHLLAGRQEDRPTGLMVWPAGRDRAEAGFAQGVSGIAYALLRLYQACGDERFKEAAQAGLAYERRARSARPAGAEADETALLSWSHGLSGAGLTRLLARTVLDEDDRDDGLEAILTRLQGNVRAAHDTLCAGTFGRVDFLQTAAQALDRPALAACAQAAAGQAVASARVRGRYRTGWGGNPPPGLIAGLAGIGYQLLRLADPAAHPSVLALAPPTGLQPGRRLSVCQTKR